MAMEELAYFVGVDWATQEHEVCVIDAQGKEKGRSSFAHSGEGLERMCSWISKVTNETAAERVAVVIEVNRGPVIAALIERGYVVLACNPKQLDRMRDRFSVAGAKDDRLDALVLASAARTDRALLREVPRDSTEMLELRELTRLHHDLVEQQIRLKARMREQFWRYFPQMLELGDVGERWTMALWRKAPSPEAAARLRRSSIETILREHRIRRITAEQVLTVLKAKKLEVIPGAAEAAILHIRTLIPQLRLLHDQVREIDKRLQAALDALVAGADGEAQDPGAEGDSAEGKKSEQRDVAILRSLPGAGKIVIATLLVESSEVLRDRDYQQLRALSGVAPVTRQTGRQGKRGGPKPTVIMRRACNGRLRNALWHWAGSAIRYDQHWREDAAALRARGVKAAEIRRRIGDKLLRVCCGCLRAGAAYDPHRWTREESHAAHAA